MPASSDFTRLPTRTELLAIAGVAMAGLAAFSIVISLFIDVDAFRPHFERALSAAIGRSVSMGHLSLSILSGSVAIDDLAIGDDPAFGSKPFVTAKRVRVGIAIVPLLVSRHLRVESFRLQDPELTLRRSAIGTWNVATLGSSTSTTSNSTASSGGFTLSIDRLAITGGRLVIDSPQARGPRRVYDDVSVDIRDLSSTARFPFRMSVTTPGGGRVTLAGTAGPFGSGGIGAAPLQVDLDASRIDVARSGFIDASSGFGGLIDLHARIVSNGQRITSSGTAIADRLQLVPGGGPARQTVDLAFASEYDTATHEGAVTKGNLRVGSATARLLGRFNARPETAVVRFTLAGNGMAVADLQAVLPAIGAALPRGSRFQSGTATVSLIASGPIDRLVIAGPIEMSKATLTGFDLGGQMQRIASLGGMEKRTETNIETLRVTLRIAADGLRADAFNCIVTAVGTLSGDGTIAANGALDFRMAAKVAQTAGVAAGIARVASFGDPERGIPFRIQGTTAAPVFVPDIRRATADAVKNRGTLSKMAGFAKSLFGSNKK